MDDGRCEQEMEGGIRIRGPKETRNQDEIERCSENRRRILAGVDVYCSPPRRESGPNGKAALVRRYPSAPGALTAPHRTQHDGPNSKAPTAQERVVVPFPTVGLAASTVGCAV
ncbi:hypothetical protein ColLi_05550 [Colletotrichum liriopes]|uniref:Uncharacterized protein n=1 Tax=Colletotrichum liriopes TaxID=708192 RepID=A0AA37GLM8_9PEZI|nr:hypothetical protein ColLi_05550 [Colletotrichum liriopes]